MVRPFSSDESAWAEDLNGGGGAGAVTLDFYHRTALVEEYDGELVLNWVSP